MAVQFSLVVAPFAHVRLVTIFPSTSRSSCLSEAFANAPPPMASGVPAVAWLPEIGERSSRSGEGLPPVSPPNVWPVRVVQLPKASHTLAPMVG